MPKGSDRRPIHDAKDRQLTYASLIFQAMTQDTSREDLAFNAELAQLSRRWERLVRSFMCLALGIQDGSLDSGDIGSTVPFDSGGRPYGSR